ncbi:MAG: hypothetical protein HKN34_11655 [Gammaproteobacteria bacterium]|nr:hypothetical protein [Gammaproteobacteria bacterium]
MSVILASGCGYTSKPTPPAVKPGSSLQINSNFNGLRNGSYIYFQNGTNLPERQLDKWSVFCALYVYNSEFGADYVTSVQPGEFQVSRSLNGREIVDSRDPSLGDIRLAGLVRWSGLDLPSYILYRTRLYLWSVDQPDVKSLTCFRKAGNYGDYYPRFEQIKMALGDMIQINR